MRLVTAVAAAAALLFSSVAESSRLTPSVVPLVVRNPYLSTWLANARDEPWKAWPMFWTGSHQGFSVMASVASQRTTFPLLGRPQDSLAPHDRAYNVSYPEWNGLQYDASTTNLSYTIHDPADKSRSVHITLSFLSPITPTSTFRQSIPASYLTAYASGNLDFDLYIDVNGQWVSGDRGSKISWSLEHINLDTDGKGLKAWRVQRDPEMLYTEHGDQAEWGSLYFSAPSDARHESGLSERLRKRFARIGTLQNEEDHHFRSIMDKEPVFAFSKSFGANRSSAGEEFEQSATFTFALIQDPVIQYAAARGLTHMRPLWASYVSTVPKILAFHYLDFNQAKLLADKYSSDLATDAFKSGAEDYVDIVALSARQVMGATHFVGTPDDPLLFMKEISSDGNTQTIDVIFPAFPFFMYTNPKWLAYLLEPLLEHMASGQYPNKYAMHDLGAHYPNATGHPDGNDERMPVEECGNILIMGLALANYMKDANASAKSSTWIRMDDSQFPHQSVAGTGIADFPLIVGKDHGVSYIDEAWSGVADSQSLAKAWVARRFSLWKQWTSYLVKYSLEPEHQLSTDDFAGPLALQTNLALKGIIGIKAMAGLSKLVGEQDDLQRYENISRTYIAKWEELGISRDKTHAKLAYDWYGSWTTTYNLYADALLCFPTEAEQDASSISWSAAGPHGVQKPLKGDGSEHQGFVPKHIYQMQSDWYFNVRQKYGLPLDSRHLYTKTDWEFWAMSVAAPDVRADILQRVAKWVNETVTDHPLTDLHNTEGDGGYPSPNFFARPVVGGHFAFLSLERACGGKAMDGLSFLQGGVATRAAMDVAAVLKREEADEQ